MKRRNRQQLKGINQQSNGHWRVNIMVNGMRMTKVCESLTEAQTMAQYIRSYLKPKYYGTEERKHMWNVIKNNSGNSVATMMIENAINTVNGTVGEEQMTTNTANTAKTATVTRIMPHQQHQRKEEEANVQIFMFPATGQGVRIIRGQDGEPWFVAKDVCRVLDLEKVDRALAGLDDDEKGTHIVSTLGGKQVMSIVSEPGLYSLIFRSRKPEAKVFSKWIRAEVLPSIRRTGTYTVPARVTDPMEHPNETLIIAQAYLLASKNLSQAQEQLALSSDIIADMTPKFECFSRFLDAKGSITLTEAAKHFNMTAQALGSFLRSPSVKWLFKNMQGLNMPTKPVIEKGYMHVITRANSRTGYIAGQGRITPKGMEALQGLLKSLA